MQHYAAFHLGLHCLQNYPFRDFPNTKDINELSGTLSNWANIIYMKSGSYQVQYCFERLGNKYFIIF